MNIETPYYIISEQRLLENLIKIQQIKESSGAKFVLALKCFATWSVFGLIKKYLDGTTSSSAYEARLGYEKFGKEVHAYCVGYTLEDIKEVSAFASKVIFNSISQLKRFYPYINGTKLGLRINPGISYSNFDLADPSRPFSRLGVINKKEVLTILPMLSGVMFHFNCENDNFENFSSNLDHISKVYGDVLEQLAWVSLGGGIYFTKKGYPIKKFCQKLKEFSKRFNIQIYFEPGESVITKSAELVTKVVDIVQNKVDIAIVDASIESHMLDLLIYRSKAKIKNNGTGKFKYMVTGRSCLSGDIFGTYKFDSCLKIGSTIKFSDAAGYTMVKKNWFNGLKMPSIAVKRLNGKIDLVKVFTYNDFLNNLS